jgi:pantoate--beta-alanine ligase
MQVIKDVPAWLLLREGLPSGRSLGFVPTMGALHQGHISLLQRSRAENDVTLVSLFVNPTQFNDPQDLKNYPRTFDSDAAMAAAAGADYVLAPEYAALYPDGYRYRVVENDLSRGLCGASRPGHFDGVLTVVLKLLQLAGADRAYFGEKDYQQYLLIKGLAEAFFLKTAIIPCPTVREPDGLAMSSRNRLLSPGQRAMAPRFHQALADGGSVAQVEAALAQAGFEVDYVEERQGRRFGAVKLGKVRLIDNVPL